MCADIVPIRGDHSDTSVPEPDAARRSPPKPDYGTRMVVALRQMAQYLDMNNRYLLKHADTTMPQLTCLEELNSRGAMTVGLLAKRVYLSPAAVFGIIDRLEEKKLVTRTRDIADRRSVFVEITEAGHDLITSSPHLLQNRLRNALKKHTEGEQIVMVNALEMTLDLLRDKDTCLQPESGN